MYKFLQIIMVLTIGLHLTGCSPTSKSTSIQPTSVPDEYIQETLPFTFSLPEEYSLQYQSRNSVSITQNDQVIGGIVLTDLHSECVHNSGCRHLRDHLSYFAPYPLQIEYIAMHFDNTNYISLQITDTEAGSVEKQSHYIFEKNTTYFDFWVDTAIISKEEGDSLFKSIYGP